MIYLLDTNVISEMIRQRPDENVLAWLRHIDMCHFSLSVLSLGEIRKGVEKIGDSSKKQRIIQWLEIDLPREFLGRIIPIDQCVSDKWGYITALSPIPAIDGLIAASALVHNQKLVTRNVKDFKNIPGLEIINPWMIEPSA
ncbi:MAG: type II toxin-antitoxin system VapC family toxin [Alphaproteobacteria bacterium]|nr:type II toxin-antitoxin system VapC family toxin [Alphaproteobacteria bacterium]